MGNLRKRITEQTLSSDMRDSLRELKRLQSAYLQWTGKSEQTSFEVDTVSLHVHERIDPATILVSVQKRVKDTKSKSLPDNFPKATDKENLIA